MEKESRTEMFLGQYETPKKAEILNNIINSIVGDIGRTIGISVSVRICYEKLESMRSIYSDVSHIDISDNKIRITLKDGVSEKNLTGILIDFFSAVGRTYSDMMGSVAKTIIRDSLKALMKKHGNRYPELEMALKKL